MGTGSPRKGERSNGMGTGRPQKGGRAIGPPPLRARVAPKRGAVDQDGGSLAPGRIGSRPFLHPGTPPREERMGLVPRALPPPPEAPESMVRLESDGCGVRRNGCSHRPGALPHHPGPLRQIPEAMSQRPGALPRFPGDPAQCPGAMPLCPEGLSLCPRALLCCIGRIPMRPGAF
jgi:hypothetical protein